ncbi:cohesin domain-containing protein [Halosolutus amylolyticus]|uniref:Cohesin domain-containing protein n=1 Tax=Halosolutus amylolyticus TaxID=2932267 RepID=A0ABD5PNP5_9EURY|nr:cohesin domain-containing protein [Halosolutus amylolyticus]
MSRTARALSIALVVVVVTSVATVGFAGMGGASDSATILEVEPETAQAPPGETIHVAIRLYNDGGYGGVGVERVAFGVEYDSDVLTIDSITRGPWLEQGNETEIVTEVDVDEAAGYAVVEQYRDPVAGGAAGNDRAATVTFTVAEDADGASSPVNVTDVETELTTDWPQTAFTHNGSVSVAADGDVVDASPPERTLDYEASTDDGGSDSIPGLGVVAPLVALAVLAGIAAFRRD